MEGGRGREREREEEKRERGERALSWGQGMQHAVARKGKQRVSPSGVASNIAGHAPMGSWPLKNDRSHTPHLRPTAYPATCILDRGCPLLLPLLPGSSSLTAEDPICMKSRPHDSPSAQEPLSTKSTSEWCTYQMGSCKACLEPPGPSAPGAHLKSALQMKSALQCSPASLHMPVI